MYFLGVITQIGKTGLWRRWQVGLHHRELCMPMCMNKADGRLYVTPPWTLQRA
ncbi:hypothetical protein CGRA01v4_06588 [Colletotrichum graminicola]|nr:hypothetical protein CGRA01v4_06588 [Colletotrichum graminicola]